MIIICVEFHKEKVFIQKSKNLTLNYKDKKWFIKKKLRINNNKYKI